MAYCVNLANIDSNVSCAESANMGGLVPRIIFGYWDDVATWPDLPDQAAAGGVSLEAAGVITGDVVMASIAKAFQLYFTEEVGSFSIAPQGDKGNISFLYTLTFINKRIRKKILGFLNAAKNRKMFFIVQDANGTWYLMGDKYRGAMLTAGEGAVTGTASTDANQVTSVFTYVSPGAYTYEGDTEDLLSNLTQGGGSGTQTAG